MTLVNLQWLDENEQRSYPLDERATRKTVNGLELPNDILADMILYFPDNIGCEAFVSSVHISDQLVTVTLCVSCDNPFRHQGPNVSIDHPLGIIPIGVIQATKAKAARSQVVSIQPLVSGVGGWAVFGKGVRQSGIWSFDNSSGSLIAPRACRTYPYQGIRSIGIKNTDTKLDGDVRIEGQGGVSTSIESRLVDTLSPCHLRVNMFTPFRMGVSLVSDFPVGSIDIKYTSSMGASVEMDYVLGEVPMYTPSSMFVSAEVESTGIELEVDMHSSSEMIIDDDKVFVDDEGLVVHMHTFSDMHVSSLDVNFMVDLEVAMSSTFTVTVGANVDMMWEINPHTDFSMAAIPHIVKDAGDMVVHTTSQMSVLGLEYVSECTLPDDAVNLLGVNDLVDMGSLENPESRCCVFSPDGEYLAVAKTSGSGAVFIYKRSSDGTELESIDATIPTGGLIPTQLAWSPDGNYLLISSATNSDVDNPLLVRAISVEDGVGNWSEEGTLAVVPSVVGEVASVRSIDWHPSGGYVAITYFTSVGPLFQHTVIVEWEDDQSQFGSLVDTSGMEGFPSSMSKWSANGGWLATASLNKLPVFYSFDADTGTLGEPIPYESSLDVAGVVVGGMAWDEDDTNLVVSGRFPDQTLGANRGVVIIPTPDINDDDYDSVTYGPPAPGILKDIQFTEDFRVLVAAASSCPFVIIYTYNSNGSLGDLGYSHEAIDSPVHSLDLSPIIDDDKGHALAVAKTSGDMGLVVFQEEGSACPEINIEPAEPVRSVHMVLIDESYDRYYCEDSGSCSQAAEDLYGQHVDSFLLLPEFVFTFSRFGVFHIPPTGPNSSHGIIPNEGSVPPAIYFVDQNSDAPDATTRSPNLAYYIDQFGKLLEHQSPEAPLDFTEVVLHVDNSTSMPEPTLQPGISEFIEWLNTNHPSANVIINKFSHEEWVREITEYVLGNSVGCGFAEPPSGGAGCPAPFNCDLFHFLVVGDEVQQTFTCEDDSPPDIREEIQVGDIWIGLESGAVSEVRAVYKSQMGLPGIGLNVSVLMRHLGTEEWIPGETIITPYYCDINHPIWDGDKRLEFHSFGMVCVPCQKWTTPGAGDCNYDCFTLDITPDEFQSSGFPELPTLHHGDVLELGQVINGDLTKTGVKFMLMPSSPVNPDPFFTFSISALNLQDWDPQDVSNHVGPVFVNGEVYDGAVSVQFSSPTCSSCIDYPNEFPTPIQCNCMGQCSELLVHHALASPPATVLPGSTIIGISSGARAVLQIEASVPVPPLVDFVISLKQENSLCFEEGETIQITSNNITYNFHGGQQANPGFAVCVPCVFEPTVVSGLSLWLDANDESTVTISGSPGGGGLEGDVEEWHDKSINGFIFEPEDSNKPEYYSNILNTNPVMRFDGSSALINGSSVLSASEAFTMFVVWRNESSDSTGIPVVSQFVDGSTNGSFKFGCRDSGKDVGVDGHTQLVGSSTLNGVHTNRGPGPGWALNRVVRRESDKSKYRVFKLGESTSTEATHNQSTIVDAPFRIGSDGDVYLDGDVAEVIIYSREITDILEIAQIEGYLQDKWGLY